MVREKIFIATKLEERERRSFEWHWKIDWIKDNGLNQWRKGSWIKAEVAFKKSQETV